MVVAAVAAAAAAVVLGVVGGVGAAAAAGGGKGGVVVVVVAILETAAAVEVVIESDFHIGIRCGVTGFGYGSGMERVWIGVWIGTRYLGRLSRYGRERGISSLV